MVDPIQIISSAILSKLAGRFVESLMEVGPDAESRHVHSWTALEDEAGETIAVVSATQLSDIDQFVRSREVGSIIQSWCILSVYHRVRHPDATKLMNALADGFRSLAVQWTEQSGQEWSSLADDLWSLLTRTVERAIPHLTKLASIERDGQSVLESLPIGADLISGSSSPPPRFIRDLTQILRVQDRILRVRDVASDISREIESAYSELGMSHSREDYRVDVDKLYVTRTLVDGPNQRQIDASEVLSPQNGTPRVVVIGDPGVGKSTMVRHLIHKEAARKDYTIAPLLIQCRDWVASGEAVSIPQYVVHALENEYTIGVDVATIEDLLTVGSAYLIFDGVDEVMDLGKRRNLVQKIESIGRRYPLTPVLATSRRVGYQSAKFKPESVKVFELNEFSSEQFDEYVKKWFDLTDRRPEDVIAFTRETQSVPDIRHNPLMLSLLCTLYRARGYIPQNRRHVYKECSDLLFQRWDAMRHIEQPYEHRQYGLRLMQELARFFYGSQRAQAGVEESQLIGIIANFFADTASIEPPENRNRAQKFVDFCADRAWLLSAKGTDHRGRRLFTFTHRTFMEYFAAESLARIAPTIDDVATDVLRCFESDPSSLVADVLVQAVDDKFERGAEQVLNKLLGAGTSARDKYLALCLRIVNSCPMSRGIWKTLPGHVSMSWSAMGIERSYASVLSFFELGRDVRAQMMRAVEDDVSRRIDSGQPLLDPNCFAYQVCSAWARLDALRETHMFDHNWESDLREIYAQLARATLHATELRMWEGGRIAIADPLLVDFLIWRGYLTPDDLDEIDMVAPNVICTAFERTIPGLVINSLAAVLYDGNAGAPEIADQIVAHFIRPYADGKISLDWDVADDLSEVLRLEMFHWPELEAEEIAKRTAGLRNVQDVLLWFCLVLYEVDSPNLHPYHQTVDGMVGLNDFRRLIITRDRALGVKVEREGKRLTKRDVGRVLAPFDTWATSWAKGHQLVDSQPDRPYE